MCGWYHGLNYYHHHHHHHRVHPHHPHPHYEPRSKRRKMDSSSVIGGTGGTGGQEVVTRLRRGSVTFRPYSDSLHHLASSSHSGSESRPENRKPLRKTALRGSASADRDRDSTSTIVENAVESGTTVGHLFPEILTMIFEYLDIQSKGRVARVCSRWRDAVYRKSVWRRVEARLHLNRSNPSLFPSIVKRGITRVQVLSLRKSLRELVNGIPNLESLNLSGCYNLTDSALDGAFNKDLPTLKSLNLSLCKEVNDNSLGRIATHCKNLENLDLGGCSKITNTGLLLISWGLKHIKRLNLRSCRSISDHGIGHLAGIDSQPSTGSKSLEELGLQDCQKVTDESLRHVAEGLPNLKSVNLSFCVSITDTGMKSLSRLHSLEVLNLRSCDNVSDIGIGFLAEDGNSGNNSSSNLRDLDVSFCNNVTDASAKHIASGINGLTSLSMTTCPVNDEGIEKIAKSLSKLKTLNIGQCSALTDSALDSIFKHCQALEKLDLYGCPKITAPAIEKVKNLPKLAHVNLNL